MASNVSVTLKLVDQMSQKLTEVANSGDRAANNIVQFGDRADEAFNRASSGSQRVIDSMQSAASATASYADSGSKAQQALDEQANAADRAAQEVGEFGDEAEQAGQDAEQFGDKASKSAMDLGDALVAAGIVAALKAIADAYFECDEAADEFEASMAKVSTIADSSAQSLDSMQADIIALSNETGQAVSDLAESTYSAISASVDTADAVGFVAQANALAVGGFTQSANAVDVLTTTINAYGLEADKAAEISDKLITTQNLGKTTVDELASSLGTVIPTAAAFGVNLDNISSAYVTLTRNGINTANSTTMLNGMLSELGDSGSEVAKILKDETGQSFAELMESGYNLGDVIQILGDSVDGNSTAFINLWGNIRAGRGAVNIFNAGAEEFAKVMDEMANSTGAADEAFRKMTDTGQFVEQKWTNAMENFKIAVGNAMPQLDGLMEKGTVVLNALSRFVEQNPAVVAGVTALAVAFGTFTAALVAHSAATLIAEKATIALTAAMDVNPIFLAVTAIAALTAGIVVFVSALEDAEFQDNRLTAASQDLADQITQQEAVVAALEEKYGVHNERTAEARAKLEELKAEFEQTGQTIGEFKQQIEATAEAVAESSAKYDDAVSALDTQQTHAETLIAELKRLESQSELTAFQQEYEKKVVEELNNVYPSLGLVYDETTGKLNKSTSALKAYCEQKQSQLKLEQDAATYMEYMDEMAQYEEEMKTAQENLTAATEAYNEALEKQGDIVTTVGGNDLMSASIETTKSAMDDAQSTVDDLSGKMEDLRGKMDALEGSANAVADSMAGVSNSADGLINTTDELSGAMEGIFAGVQEQAEELAAAYQEAYDAAASAVDSSFGLFEKIELDTSQSAQSMVEALQTQAEYLEQYTQNLEKAKEYGIDASLVQDLADGSQESAAALDTIITKIEDLGGSTENAKEYINELNSAFKKVEEGKKTLEETMVSMNETLQTKMEELKGKMEEGINKLKMSSQAAAAAKETMSAYADEIAKQGQAAISAAEKVAAAVSAALSKAKVSGSSGSTAKHANGTTYGEDVYIAGEAGPELIVGRRGSEVFPAAETAKILSAVVASREDSNLSPAPAETIVHKYSEEKKSSTSSELQTLNININGKGNLQMYGGGLTMQRVGEYVSENLESWILNLAEREIYEEGQKAYEY
ncbi:MAG: phage tail tape measure protein [Lachnospiraceae bacterium]|nr:phage tail tape measure protein [Lachnospiraceae bacterium]